VTRSKLANPAFIAGFGLLLAAAVGLSQAMRVMGVYLTKKPVYPASGLAFHTMPDEYPSWKQIGRDEPMSKEAAEELGTDNSISRVYVEKNPPPGRLPRKIQLHIAYYTGMIDTVPHVPERCMVGAGWQMGSTTSLVDVPLDLKRAVAETGLDVRKHGASQVLRAMATNPPQRVRLPIGIEKLQMTVTPFLHAGGRTLNAGYFFIANGGVVASANQVRFLAFKLDQRYAFYCKVQFSSDDVESPQELGVLAGSMLDEMFGDIMQRVPDWIEVVEGRHPDGDDTGSSNTP
jgi:hypothetical protein